MQPAVGVDPREADTLPRDYIKIMGWCSGTDIFDSVCQVLFDPNVRNGKEIVKRLVEILEDHDWDCHQDSRYWDTPVVQEVMRELHPSWFEDE